MKTLTLAEIKTAVNKKRKGTYRKIEWIDGQSIPFSRGVNLTVTKTAIVRFGISSKNTQVAKLEKSIYEASTKEELATIVNTMKELSSDKLESIQPRAKELLTYKCSVAKEGKARACSAPEGKPLTRDEECKSIIYCKNGNILLQCYKGFSRESGAAYGAFPRMVKTNYYLEKDGKITKVDNESMSPEQAERFKKVSAEARRIDGKKTDGSGAIHSSTFTLSTKRIVRIK